MAAFGRGVKKVGKGLLGKDKDSALGVALGVVGKGLKAAGLVALATTPIGIVGAGLVGGGAFAVTKFGKKAIEAGKRFKAADNASRARMVARFGGDEYCIFVKDIPSETLADKLNFAIDKLSDIYTNNGIRVSLTASIGAAYCKRNSIGYKELMDMADSAAYQAKDNGRNCYIIKDVE